MAAGVNGEHDFEDPFSTNPHAMLPDYWFTYYYLFLI
jgi:hypothetical protein